MPDVFNRARMTTATTGTGTITLGSAVLKYQSFASAGVTNGTVVHYTIEDDTAWEIGTGTYTTTGTTLSRTLVQSSTGSLLNLSGTAEVFITAPATAIRNLDAVDPPVARTNLGLGSAATLTAGTSANNAVQLDGSARLPAVDGSQLTNLPASSATGGLLRAPQILTSGTSYTTPAGCNSIYVEAVGAGGGGGGADSDGSADSQGGGGGGAGGYAAKYFTVSPSTAYTYAIGASGAAGGSGGSTGGAGGNTTFTVGATTLTANGGSGGGGSVATEGGLGGDGGTASNGDLNLTGSDGATGVGSISGSTGSGTGGSGGSSFFGGSGRGSSADGAGQPGSSGSGGGGGANTNDTTGAAGGAGGAGLIRVWEYT